MVKMRLASSLFLASSFYSRRRMPNLLTTLEGCEASAGHCLTDRPTEPKDRRTQRPPDDVD